MHIELAQAMVATIRLTSHGRKTTGASAHQAWNLALAIAGNQLPGPRKLRALALHKVQSPVCTLLGLTVNIASMLVKQFTANIRTAAFTRALRPARSAGPHHRKTMASAATDKIVFWDILPAPGGCKRFYNPHPSTSSCTRSEE